MMAFREFRNCECKYKDCMHNKESVDECMVKQKF